MSGAPKLSGLSPDAGFPALMLEDPASTTRVENPPHVRQIQLGDLPERGVLVRVECSSLNYKDALAVTGRGKVIRRFPMIPGVDLAGTVVSSDSCLWNPGDSVLVTGWGLGETHWGGFSAFARVPGEMLLRLPDPFSARQAMALGTAGLTAMLCVMALEAHGHDHRNSSIVVTGAGGGVGCLAVAVLSRSGYQVTASTGRPDLEAWLKSIGAAAVVGRLLPTTRPLETERWDSAVDVVGGPALASLLPAMSRGSAITTCGLAGGADLSTTVFPFIIRGVSLIGVDSVYHPQDRRRTAWNRLAELLSPEIIDTISDVTPLTHIVEASHDLLSGRVRGRLVVDVHA